MAGGRGLSSKSLQVRRRLSECALLLGGVDALINAKGPPVSSLVREGRRGHGLTAWQCNIAGGLQCTAYQRVNLEGSWRAG